jgi:hypothetical protein
MVDKEKQALINRYVKAYNAFDVEGMINTVSNNIEFENISQGEVNAYSKGIHEFRELAEQGQLLFSSREQSITAMETLDEQIITHIDYRGVLATDLPNGLKEGEVLTLTGQSIFSFQEGKISRIQDVSDE